MTITAEFRLTPAQAALLDSIVGHPRMSSRAMHTGTRISLESRGLIRMVDRFADGTALYSATTRGIIENRA